MPRTLTAAALAVAALALTPAAASAADTYVNGDGGGASDANDCRVITMPCLTIGQGLIQAGVGDTVHVDDSSSNYLESQVLDDGKSVVADNFAGDGPGAFTISGTIGATISVGTGETGGTVSGFTLAPAAGQFTVFLQGPVTLRDNMINQPNDDGVAIQIVAGGGTGTVIDDNSFNGDDTTTNTAIHVSDGTPQITGNAIGAPLNGFNRGLLVDGGANPTITGNEIHAVDEDDIGNVGVGIQVSNAQATIRRNEISEFGMNDAWGITYQDGGTPSGGTASGNTVIGNGDGIGILAQNTQIAVNLDNNLVTDFGVGLDSTGTAGPAANDGDVTAINMTLASNNLDVRLADTHLTLDSSIVAGGILVLSAGGNPGCTITFSQGPTATPGGDGCGNFQTTADPMFVAPGSGDYHLQPASTMIEAGNPAAPAAGATDFDGGPRVCDGDGDGVPERDIGADEYRSPAGDDCAAPNTAVVKVRSKRARRRAKRRARVTFSSTDPSSSFRCKLDKGAFKACPATKVFRRLKLGRHTVTAFAIDAFGNVDQTPVRRSFRARRPRPHRR